MTSTLSTLPLRDSYRTGPDNLVGEFYAPCLNSASEYDRAVGYFRSTVFVVAGPQIVDFALRGGRLRLVCSPDLDEADVEAMTMGYEGRQRAVERALVRDVDALVAIGGPQTRVLATMIETGAMDIRVAFRVGGNGMYHEKLGLFVDERGDEVSFRGSANETFRAWDVTGNAESFDVFCSWLPGDARRVAGHRETFERLWSGGDAGVETIPFPEVARDRLRPIAYAGLSEARERLAVVAEPSRAPGLIGERSPLPHQTAALDAWRDRGRRGILKHATGSGKTFTALVAIDGHLGDDGSALVLVPSRLLLRQWEQEIRETLRDVTLLQAGDGRDAWRRPGWLETSTGAPQGLGRRVILATMQTAASPEFRRRLRSGPHLLVVADEVHRTGSPRHRGLFGIDAGPRLGLSATPERYGDPEGTAALMSYFGGVVPPPFTLADAIAAGRLVPYEYHPHVVRLAPDEQAAWSDLTREIRRLAAIQRGGSGNDDRRAGPPSERLKHLLIQRARVVKKATAKVGLASEVLRTYRDGDRWLVYCEDTAQLEAVAARLRADGLPVTEYHTSMEGDERATLEWFREVGGIVVAIRCLDEGVDIPQSSHALILASSQNPREFIQRRGRVLRTASPREAKYFAVIHDALVVPTTDDEDTDTTAVARTELRRAVEFAEHALNGSSRVALAEVGVEAGIDLDEISGPTESDDTD